MDPADKAAASGPGSLPVRLFQVFISPGELFRGLKDDPRWFTALLVGAIVVSLSMILVPADLWTQAMREQAAARGGEVPAFMESAGPMFRLASAVSGLVFYFLWAFLLAGIVTFVFAFLLGDDGRYVQYLSVVAHSLFITAAGSLLLLPLRIIQGDPQLTLNLGTFFFFLDEGYLFRVLKLLELFGLWGYVVMAIGVTQIDSRRSLGFAVSFFMSFALVFALIFGIFGG